MSYNLPGAEKEVREATEIFNGDAYIGETATVDNFLEKATQYRILVLAMHGLSDAENLQNARLLFTHTPSQPKQEARYSTNK